VGSRTIIGVAVGSRTDSTTTVSVGVAVGSSSIAKAEVGRATMGRKVLIKIEIFPKIKDIL
jgi:hypothetical protein